MRRIGTSNSLTVTLAELGKLCSSGATVRSGVTSSLAILSEGEGEGLVGVFAVSGIRFPPPVRTGSGSRGLSQAPTWTPPPALAALSRASTRTQAVAARGVEGRSAKAHVANAGAGSGPV